MHRLQFALFTKKTIMLSHTDIDPLDGNSPLHRAARECTSFDDFIKKITQHTADENNAYALTPNHCGHLPIDLISPTLLSADKKRVYETLLSLALNKKKRPLHEPIYFFEAKKPYKPARTSPLFYNLTLATFLVNETRALKKWSTSHPSNNGIDVAENFHATKKLVASRILKINRAFKTILAESNIVEIVDQGHSLIQAQFSKETAERLQNDSNSTHDVTIMNCQEMAAYACYIGQKMHLNIKPYHYKKGAGDHIFTVIFADKDTPNAWPSTFGPHDVLCDPWSGLVCLAREYMTKLGDFRQFRYQDKIYNLITKFNPHYHQIEFLNFYGSRSEVAFSLKMQNDNELGKLLSTILPTCSVAEKFLYRSAIHHNLTVALEHRLIDFHHIQQWTDPKAMLKKYFSPTLHYMPLINALYANDRTVYKGKLAEALTNGANPNHTDNSGRTTLYEAARYGYNEIVDLLIQAKADPNLSLHSDNSTPLSIAIQYGYVHIVDALLAHPDIELKPLRNTVENFRRVSKSKNHATQERMEKHFLTQKISADSEATLFMTIAELADIMGYTSLLEKWQRLLKQNATSSQTLTSQTVALLPQFSMFTATQNPTPDTTLIPAKPATHSPHP